jgi:hypothetical protein
VTPTLFRIPAPALLVSALFFAACGPKDLPITPLDDVCEVGEYGKSIRTAGYLMAPGTMMCDGITCEMTLSNIRAGGRTALRIDIPLGSGRNAMVEPPDTYQESDLVVRDHEGNPHVPGDWVVVQGRILNEQACLISPVSYVFAGEPSSAGGATAGSGAAPQADPTAAPAAGSAPAPAAAPSVPAAVPGTAPAPSAAPEGGKPEAPAPAAGKP